jgi:hypothetical protein
MCNQRIIVYLGAKLCEMRLNRIDLRESQPGTEFSSARMNAPVILINVRKDIAGTIGFNPKIS